MHTPNDLLAALGALAEQTGLKVAEVSAERAQKALTRLNAMEGSRPSVGQVGRYAGIGGLGGALTAATGNVIEHYKRSTTPGIKGRLMDVGLAAVNAGKNKTVSSRIRSVAASGARGALGGSVIPLLRTSTDRLAEKKVLHKYLGQSKENLTNPRGD